ncbi:hypothetical protein [Afifella pfennigii]|uniref:hypothetical protein n=1 Tax=Afifella pfennigii TaxID=209897 RepID=UPI000479F2A8|nr:hypothetical protein [Afifella pfennigii]
MSMRSDCPAPDGYAAGPGLLKRLARAMAASRLCGARREINLYLSRLDDEELRRLGFRRAEIAKNRASDFRF